MQPLHVISPSISRPWPHGPAEARWRQPRAPARAASRCRWTWCSSSTRATPTGHPVPWRSAAPCNHYARIMHMRCHRHLLHSCVLLSASAAAPRCVSCVLCSRARSAAALGRGSTAFTRVSLCYPTLSAALTGLAGGSRSSYFSRLCQQPAHTLPRVGECRCTWALSWS